MVKEKGKAGKTNVVITEIPYTMIGANISKFLFDVAALAEKKLTNDIVDITNQSSKEGIRIVIELKKDSGYDNAYEQTVRYLESPTMQKLSGKKKLYGIICLNDPSNKLIQAVKKDARIRLFEYQISYSEVL